MDRSKLTTEQLNRISVEEFKREKKTPIMIVLDNIRSMTNIGSIFRTADAFLSEGIFLCGITATPPNREINKTALGATDSVDWQYVPDSVNCVKELKEKGYTLLALEQTKNSIMLQNFKIDALNLTTKGQHDTKTPEKEQQKYAVVLGNEVEGVNQEVIDLCDYVIEIPQFGTKHSFNVSVSCGIVLWEIVKQIKFPLPEKQS